MPITVTIEEAQGRLRDLIADLGQGAEVIITDNEKPVARLVGGATGARRPRRPGSAKGKLNILVEDEDHLKDFREYMP